MKHVVQEEEHRFPNPLDDSNQPVGKDSLKGPRTEPLSGEANGHGLASFILQIFPKPLLPTQSE